MEEEWQKMIEHEGTMYAILKKYNLYEKKEDYIDICYIGYTKAVNNYDKSKASLRSYIYKCVENEILHELSKEKAQKRQREELSFDFAYDEIGHDLNDIIPSNENIESDVIKKEEVANLYKTIKKLDVKEQFIIRNLFGIDCVIKTQIELSNLLSISQMAMSKKKDKILLKMRGMMEDENNNISK